MSRARIFDADRAQDICDRYKAGASIRQLALIAGVSYGTIWNTLTEAGVQLRKRGGAR